MTPQHDEVKDTIRAALAEGLVPAEDANFSHGGLNMIVTHIEEGRMRFDLPQVERSLELIGSRLYEREFVGLSDGDDLAELDMDPDQLAVEEYAAELADEHEGEGGDPDGGEHLALQLDYKGEPETVDTRRFNNKVVCACGNVRWVKSADLFQVKLCKPCVQAGRRQRRLERARAKRKGEA